MRLLSSLFLVMIAFSLTACGKKGPLKLPTEKEATQQAFAEPQLPRLISFQEIK